MVGAADDRIWPFPPGHPCYNYRVESLVCVYESLGYRVCASAVHEPNCEKIAIYGRNGIMNMQRGKTLSMAHGRVSWGQRMILTIQPLRHLSILRTGLRRLDSTVRFRIVFHGCLAEEVSSWLSGYPALNPALYPALYLQIEPRPSKCHHASWTNNLKRLGRFSAKKSENQWSNIFSPSRGQGIRQCSGSYEPLDRAVCALSMLRGCLDATK